MRTLRSAVVVLALGLAAATLPGSSAQATSAGFQIIARHSGRCLDVVDASPANTAPIQQFTCLGATQLNQVWLLVPAGAGFQIVAQHSGKCLDVKSASPFDTAPLQQFTCIGATQTNQVWTLVPVPDGSGDVELRPLHQPTKCADVVGASIANGARVQQITCIGTTNQRWRLNPVAIIE